MMMSNSRWKNDIRWWQTKLKDETRLMRITKKAILKNKDIEWLWKKKEEDFIRKEC